jgi:hypothetical protein
MGTKRLRRRLATATSLWIMSGRLTRSSLLVVVTLISFQALADTAVRDEHAELNRIYPPYLVYFPAVLPGNPPVPVVSFENYLGVRANCDSSNRSTTSSITAATPGTPSSTSRGRSCPSRNATGQPSVTHCEDWYYSVHHAAGRRGRGSTPEASTQLPDRVRQELRRSTRATGFAGVVEAVPLS